MVNKPHKGATIAIQPRIRKGAFFDAAWRHGCRKFSVYNRTYISSTFSNPTEEYWNVTKNVAIWPVMGERQVEISGSDAAEFVQLLTSRDMSTCSVNQCKYALITDESGGIVCDPIILKLSNDRFWLSTSDCDLELWAKGVAVHAPLKDIKIFDANVSVVQIQGPKSPNVICDMFGEEVLDLRYYWHRTVKFQGTEVRISRTGWSGEFGYELYLENYEQGDALFDALLDVGKPYGAAPGAVNQTRRIESGILSWGVDMGVEENPYEVGLGRLVELENDNKFIGRSELEKIRKQPLEKTLVGLILEGPPIEANETPWDLLSKGEKIGRLTSLSYSPRLEKNIALGLVRNEHSTVGTELSVFTWEGEKPIYVSNLPFLPKLQTGDARALLNNPKI